MERSIACSVAVDVDRALLRHREHDFDELSEVIGYYPVGPSVVIHVLAVARDEYLSSSFCSTSILGFPI